METELIDSLPADLISFIINQHHLTRPLLYLDQIVNRTQLKKISDCKCDGLGTPFHGYEYYHSPACLRAQAEYWHTMIFHYFNTYCKDYYSGKYRDPWFEF